MQFRARYLSQLDSADRQGGSGTGGQDHPAQREDCDVAPGDTAPERSEHSDDAGRGYTSSLLDHARAKFPRLRFDLSENGLRDFLIDEERIGIACTKYRNASANGWSFPPLAECREAFDKLYGPIAWDNPEVLEWSKKGSLLD
jgi:hypothetical protein